MQPEITDKNHGKYSMYFLAIVCPSELDDKVQKHKQWLQKNFGCVNALKSPAHITLIPPFWWKTDEEQMLRQWLHGFKPYDPFVIETNGIDTFGKNVLFIDVLSSTQLLAMHYAIQQHFATRSGARIKTDNRSFRPHITLATRDIKPGDMEKAIIFLTTKISHMKFQCKGISLLKLSEGKWNVMNDSF